MTVTAHVRTAAFEAFLERQQHKDVLRFIACGSVDDGKSTLIGRLLHDTKQILDDQIAMLTHDSRRHGTTGDALDLALLVDGLSAEREQRITIDVAYRYFSTEARSFVVADTPGHEQYTRNMATGASTADVAVLLVDALQGLTRQTRRHALIAAMLGIRRVALAINKMDVVGWSKQAYETVFREFGSFARDLGFEEIVGIPLSALNGDNVVLPGVAAPWYEGPTLLRYLECVPVGDDAAQRPFRMAVQRVIRPNANFRGYAGLIASGRVAIGDAVRVLPSGAETRVTSILTPEGSAAAAIAGQSVTVELADAIDVSRGALLSAAGSPAQAGSRLGARVFCTGTEALRPGTPLLLKIGAATVNAVIERVQARIEPDNLRLEPAPALAANDLGDVVISLDRAVAFDDYRDDRETGSFILIDRESAATIALGLVTSNANDQEVAAKMSRPSIALSSLLRTLRAPLDRLLGGLASAASEPSLGRPDAAANFRTRSGLTIVQRYGEPPRVARWRASVENWLRVAFAVVLAPLAFSSSTLAQGTTLRVGHFPNITHVQALVARALERQGRSWFTERLGPGVKIEWYTYNAGPSAMEAIFAKSLDLTYVGPNPALNAYTRSRGDEVRVVAGAVNGGSALVVQRDGGLSKPADFRGKRIATPQFGNTQDVAARAWLVAGGLRITQTGGDAQVIPTSNPDQLSLFQSKQLDAVWTVEPWVSRLEAEAGGRVLVEEKDAITTVLTSSVAVLANQRDLAKRFVAAHRELTDWIRQNPEEAQRLAREELQTTFRVEMSPELVARAWSRMTLTAETGLDAFQAFVASAQQVGFLRGTPDLSRLIEVP